MLGFLSLTSLVVVYCTVGCIIIRRQLFSPFRAVCMLSQDPLKQLVTKDNLNFSYSKKLKTIFVLKIEHSSGSWESNHGCLDPLNIFRWHAS